MRRTTRRHRLTGLAAVLALCAALLPAVSQAIPEFARKYSMSCAACHAAFPRLNAFGEHFRDSNMRLPNWRDNTAGTGD
ncbi:MAG TPA: hypothetical protein ENJ35_07965, partial [Gammaproteobacteria bacterium]|nr:hypothetical protein [Gammaproteobacteria bacterium]